MPIPTGSEPVATAPFELVIFDLDGTLVDSAPDIAWSLNATLAEAGLPTLPLETVRGLVGDGATKLLERALPTTESHRAVGPLVARFIGHYSNHLSVDSRLYGGIAGLLDSLAQAGIRMAVVTNKPHALAQDLMATLGVDHHFFAIIGDGNGFPRKPDPAAAHSIIARAATTPERTIVVGDGLPDVALARAIPCSMLAVTWGYVPAARLTRDAPTFLASSTAEARRVLFSSAIPRIGPSAD